MHIPLPPPPCRHLLHFHLYTTATTRRHRGRVVARWGRERLSNGNSRWAGWRRRRGSMTGVKSHSIHLFDMHQGEGQYIFASPLFSNANSICFDSFVGTWNYEAQCPQEAFLRLPWLVELSLNGGYMHTDGVHISVVLFYARLDQA
jgi:hypothetical protein